MSSVKGLFGFGSGAKKTPEEEEAERRQMEAKKEELEREALESLQA